MTMMVGWIFLSIGFPCDQHNCNNVHEYCILLHVPFCITAMIIGFTQRRQTVSEADRPFPQDQSFEITVNVSSMIVSEINYDVFFEAPASNIGRTANVGDNQSDDILDHDALFGSVNPITGDLEDFRPLINGSTVLSTPLTLTIINDFNPEPMECFTIDIASPDVIGDRDIYECFDDDDNMDSFFCLHEICIEDDDGLFSDIHLSVLLKIYDPPHPEPFVVALVETMYTVMESELQVEVCVNLTHPHQDILEETVRVNVFNNESSVYIPDGAVLASTLNLHVSDAVV